MTSTFEQKYIFPLSAFTNMLLNNTRPGNEQPDGDIKNSSDDGRLNVA